MKFCKRRNYLIVPIRPLLQQRGASLIVSLLMLVAVLLLGISAAQISLQGEKASRNDRDRQIAFQAAEAALQDAEMDIENSPDAKSHSPRLVFESPAVWLTVDFTDAAASSTKSVPFGNFTGQKMQTGKGGLPSKLPRYIIEVLGYRVAGGGAEEGTLRYFYRITAMGFGARESTQVVLQTFYRKIDK